MRQRPMSANIDEVGSSAVPAGVYRVGDRHSNPLHIPDIKVRCRRQAADDPPWYARSRFAWNMGEVSGSLGDLGTFLPHIVGAITIVGMDPTGILTTFGLFYAFAGAFYGVPMAVQPMKAASAAVLIEPMNPAAIAGAGLVIGAFFLVLGLTGVVSRLARVLPRTIASGLQLGLGLSLAGLGLRLIERQVWLGIAISALMLVLMRFKRAPVALVAVVVGIVAGQAFGLAPRFPALDLRAASAAPDHTHLRPGDARHRVRCAAADPAHAHQRHHRDRRRIAPAFSRRSRTRSTSATSRSPPASATCCPRLSGDT